MIVLEVMTWWYGQGWLQIVKNVETRLRKVSHLFSVPILVRTLFAPWRRIVTYPGSSIEAKFHAMTDNLVSRVVGFTVRTLVLFTAGIMLLLAAIVGLLQCIVWPLVPLGIVAAVVLGLVGH